MKKYMFALISFTFIGFAPISGASIVTYDFAKEGNVHEAGYATFVSAEHDDPNPAHSGKYQMPGGLSITASNGSGLSTKPKDAAGADIVGPVSTQYEAYMDAKSGGEDAGLGVCHTVGSCAGISDDNQMKGEYIHMVFDTIVDILSLDITGDHTAVDDDAIFHYSLDQGSTWDYFNIGGEVIDDPLLISSLLPGQQPWLTNTLDYTIEGGQMYLAAMTVNPVPIPAALWLFGTALIGLVGFSKRRKEA